MFNFTIDTEWEDNLKDKMITFVDLYRKHYKEKIKNVDYKRGYHENYRIIITYSFENVIITFEGVEEDNNKWICLIVDVDSDDKKYLDEKYDFILKIIKDIGNN